MSENTAQKQRVSQYQRKTEDSKEEVKAGDQQPPRREGGRGGHRGGRGGNQGGDRTGTDRPKTAAGDFKAKPYYQRRKEGAAAEGDQNPEGGDAGHKGGERPPRKDLDQNSWMYKFLHAPRPKFEQVVVTVETEVPATIPKDQRKKEPSKEDYEKKMKELDNKIQTIRDKINELVLKKREAREGGKMSGSQMTFREALTQKIEEVKALRQQKNSYHKEKDAIVEKINTLDLEKQQLLKNMTNSKDMMDPAKIQAKIIDLDRRIETTTMPPGEEKKMIAEIKRLKESIPNAQKAIDIKPKVDAFYEQRNQLNEKINSIRPTLEAKEKEIDAIKKQLEEDFEQKEEVKDRLNKFDDEITKQKAELQKVFDLKDATREEHFKGRYEYQIEQDQVRWADRIAREKQRIIENDKAKQERITARKQQLADRPNPYLKEIETCDRLIQYCQLLKRKTGLVQTEEVIKEEQKQIINSLAKEDLQKKVKDGKIEQVMSKREREEAAVIRVGGKGKGKGGQKRREDRDDEVDVFSNIDISILNLFGFLKVSPPLDKAALDPKIQELQEKFTYYNTEGEKLLKDEEDKLMAGDLNEEPEEIKESADDDNYRRGGRGGRGGFRGGRGGRGGYRTGTAGGDKRPPRKNDEDNDVYISSDDEAQRVSKKPNAGKRADNKKEDLNVDDNNFPTL